MPVIRPQDPTATKPPARSPESAPPEPDAPGNPAADKFTDVLGLQGLAQDGTRSAALVGKGKASLASVAAFTAGESDMVAAGTGRAVETASRMGRAGRLAAPALQKVGPALGLAGRLGPIVSIPFAGYDVYKAVVEKDPVKKPAAAANATFTVAGTVMGTAGVLLLATPFALPLLAGSAAIGGFQIWDAYMNGGAAQGWVGDKLIGPLLGLGEERKPAETA